MIHEIKAVGPPEDGTRLALGRVLLPRAAHVSVIGQGLGDFLDLGGESLLQSEDVTTLAEHVDHEVAPSLPAVVAVGGGAVADVERGDDKPVAQGTLRGDPVRGATRRREGENHDHREEPEGHEATLRRAGVMPDCQ